MKKKKRIDFIITEQDDSRLIFRFYPRRSSCHSFDENPPKDWNSVYKVYYSYAIIKQWKFEANEQWQSTVMYLERCDECSIIDGIGRVCFDLAKGYEIFEREDGEKLPLLDREMLPFGMGTSWTISKSEWTDWSDENLIHTYFNFTLFGFSDKGFRFSLPKEKLEAFGSYLIECCEYMLAHGDPV